MTSVIDVMSDAIGALDYATDALEAPAGSQMRQTVRDLKDARRTVADVLAAMDTALEMLVDSWGEEQIAAGDDQVANVLKAAIKAAKGEE